MAEQQAGWYPDPSGDATKLRYWDGNQWTNDFTDMPGATQQDVSAGQPEAAAPVQAEEAAPQVPEAAPVAESAQMMDQAQQAMPAESAQPEVAAAQIAEPTPSVVPEQPVAQAQPEPQAPAQAQPEPAQAAQAVPAQAQPAPIPVQTAQPAEQAPGAPMGQPAQPQMQPQAPTTMPSAQPAQPYAPPAGGAPLQQQPMYAQTPGAPKKKKNRAPLIVGIIVGVIVLVAIVVGVLIFSNILGQVDTMTGTESAIMLEGEYEGIVGQEYETKWFTFTVDSLTTDSSYGDYTAAEGNILIIAHITETNVSGSTQAFGSFDWLIDDDTSPEYIYAIEATNDKMMPDRFELDDDETASYDLVFECPADLPDPFLMYTETDTQGNTYATFKLFVY